MTQAQAQAMANKSAFIGIGFCFQSADRRPAFPAFVSISNGHGQWVVGFLLELSHNH
jgi:hypothetical protein